MLSLTFGSRVENADNSIRRRREVETFERIVIDLMCVTSLDRRLLNKEML